MLQPPPRRASLRAQAYVVFGFLALLVALIALSAWRAADRAAALPAWFPPLLFGLPFAFVVVIFSLYARALRIQFRLAREGILKSQPGDPVQIIALPTDESVSAICPFTMIRVIEPSVHKDC